jgi:tetratricopeptide (TPR) repeat protein
MKPTSAFKARLERIDTLWKPGHFSKALALVDRLLTEWPDNPLLLVKRGQLIQLQESEDGPGLEEARAMLERAAELDEESPLPLIELGFFLFAVEDNAAAAAECFKKAEALGARLLKECRKGKKAALAELSEDKQPKSTPARNGPRRQVPRAAKSS